MRNSSCVGANLEENIRLGWKRGRTPNYEVTYPADERQSMDHSCEWPYTGCLHHVSDSWPSRSINGDDSEVAGKWKRSDEQREASVAKRINVYFDPFRLESGQKGDEKVGKRIRCAKDEEESSSKRSRS